MTTDSSDLRVLVVDDEDDVRLVLTMQLDLEPDISVVGAAADGAEAVTLCRELDPDVVVMDLLMPNVSGFEAIQSIRDEMPRTGIVAYTGVAGDFVRSEMQRLDIPLVLKSGDAAVLVSAVRKVAGGG